MKRFFHLYHYLSPLVTLPLAYFLWLKQTGGEHRLVWLALALPIVTAYVIPGLGVNRFRLWEFHARWRAGGFFPHHGLIFGGSISLLTLLCVDMASPHVGWFSPLRTAFVTGSALAFWNWLFDIYLIKSGVMTVYNRPWFEKRGPEAIAAAYAPLYFFVFGACYGLTLDLARYYLRLLGRWELWPLLLTGGLVITLTLPTLTFVLVSYWQTGTPGLHPYRPEAQ